MMAWKLLLALVAALAGSEVALAASSDPVEVFFGDDFEERIKEKNGEGANVLVVFMAPWCGNCRAFMPDFRSAARKISDMQTDGAVEKVVFAEIDADTYKEVAKEYGIDAYPTLKWFPVGGKPQDFAAAMSADGIMRFIKQSARQPIKSLASKEDLERFAQGHESVTFRDSLVILAARNATANEHLWSALEFMAREDVLGRKFAFYESNEPVKAVVAALRAAGRAVEDIQLNEGIIVVRPERFGIRSIALDELLKYKAEHPEEDEDDEDDDEDDFSEEDLYNIAMDTFLGDACSIPSAIVDLTSDNFVKTIESNEFVLVEFMAPWCGFCKKLAPVYERLALQAATAAPNVVIAKVDATAEKAIAEQYEVSAYPTLYWFRNGQAHPFNSQERKDVGILLEWIKRMIRPTFSATLAGATVQDIEDFTASVAETGRTKIVLLLRDPSAKPSAVLDDVAYGLDFEFALAPGASSEAWSKYFGPDGAALEQAMVVVHEDGVATVSAADVKDWASADELRKAIRIKALPLVPLFTDDVLDDGIDIGIKVFVFLISPPDDISRPTFKEFARMRSGGEDRVMFTWVDFFDEEMEFAMDFFLVDDEIGTKVRFVRAVHVRNNDIGGAIYGMAGESGEFKLEGAEVTIDGLGAFLDAMLAGKMEPMNPEDLEAEFDEVDEEEQEGGAVERDEL